MPNSAEKRSGTFFLIRILLPIRMKPSPKNCTHCKPHIGSGSAKAISFIILLVALTPLKPKCLNCGMT